MKNDSTPEQIKEAGLKLAALLCGEKGSDTLSTFPYSRYMKMAARSSVLKSQKLPFTEKAVYFHYLRVYHHVQEWNTLQEGSSNCRFGHIYQDTLNANLHFLCSVN